MRFSHFFPYFSSFTQLSHRIFFLLFTSRVHYSFDDFFYLFSRHNSIFEHFFHGEKKLKQLDNVGLRGTARILGLCLIPKEVSKLKNVLAAAFLSFWSGCYRRDIRLSTEKIRKFSSFSSSKTFWATQTHAFVSEKRESNDDDKNRKWLKGDGHKLHMIFSLNLKERKNTRF